MIYDFDGAPCLNNPGLWASTHRSSHEEAAKGCKVCPHVDACRDRLAFTFNMSASMGAMGGPEGTCAGELINPRKKVGRSRKDDAA